jgi:hypothetical protein
MNVNRLPHLLTLAFATLALTACGSIGLPDILGGGTGGGGTGTPQSGVVSVRGTVERVDTSARMIVVDGDAAYRNLRNAGSGDTLAVYYDNDTVVVYEGRTYSPADLERGDRIVADVDDSGNRLVAERIEVTHDVTGDTGTVYGDERRVADLRGTVRSIDTRGRTIELERTSYRSGFTTGTSGTGVVTVHYDADTSVRYEGRLYGPENLERGDVVDVEVTDTGSRLVAEQIEVVSDVRAGFGSR